VRVETINRDDLYVPRLRRLPSTPIGGSAEATSLLGG
jgi:hypothetical protein